MKAARASPFPISFVALYSLCRLFMECVPVKPWVLAPAVSLPVSRGTPSLNTLATWDHREVWPLVINTRVSSRGSATDAARKEASCSSSSTFRYADHQHATAVRAAVPRDDALHHAVRQALRHAGHLPGDRVEGAGRRQAAHLLPDHLLRPGVRQIRRVVCRR